MALRGSAAFRPPRIISSPMNVIVFEDSNTIITTNSRPDKTPDFSVPEVEAECQRLISRWETNQLDISLRRSGWYSEEYASWQLLPWSQTDIIQDFNEFIYHHAMRNLVECRKLEKALNYLGEIKTQRRQEQPNLYSWRYILALLSE